MVRAGVAYQYPEIKVHTAELPFSYIDAQKKAMGPTGGPTHITGDQREKHRLSEVLTPFPEVRRERPIVPSFLVHFKGTNRVHHLVASLQKASRQLELTRVEIKRPVIQGDKLTNYRGESVLDPATPIGSDDSVIRALLVAYHMATPFETKRILKRVKQPLINTSGHAITAKPRRLGYMDNMNHLAHTAKKRGHLLETNRWVTD